jgi:glycosyltransferase involved in cell wall biosynthesis
MKLSVVMPAYDRPDVLGPALRAWGEQRRLPDELVVVDDGSPGAAIHDVVTEAAAALPFEVIVVTQPNAGPAAARNRGVSACSGDVVLFTGDDILPQPELAFVHMEVHAAGDESTAVLGRTVWSPEHEITPLMAWIDEGCVLPQFEYSRLTPGKEVEWRYFYTSNVSVRRPLLLDSGGFDERFRYAYGEDGELGHRLHGLGMRLVYEPAALAHHVHLTTVRDLGRRAWVAGYTAHLLPTYDPALESPRRAGGRFRRSAGDRLARAGLRSLQVWDARRWPVSAAVGKAINWCLGRRFLAGMRDAARDSR